MNDDVRELIAKLRAFMELNGPELGLDIQQLMAEAADMLKAMLPEEREGVCWCTASGYNDGSWSTMMSDGGDWLVAALRAAIDAATMQSPQEESRDEPE